MMKMSFLFIPIHSVVCCMYAIAARPLCARVHALRMFTCRRIQGVAAGSSWGGLKCTKYCNLQVAPGLAGTPCRSRIADVLHVATETLTARLQRPAWRLEPGGWHHPPTPTMHPSWALGVWSMLGRWAQGPALGVSSGGSRHPWPQTFA